MSEVNSEILDLNSLMPDSRRIRFGNPPKEVDVKPPTTGQVLKLGALGKKMQDIDNMSAEETEALVNRLTAEVKVCIPELADQELNTAQLMKLLEMIIDMGMPGQVQELAKKGITVDTAKKIQ